MSQEKAVNVTDAELEILKLMWDRDLHTARGIRDVLYPNSTSSDRATVQKLLERLEAKGVIERDRSEFVHTFRPTITRDELVGQQIEALASRLTDGSLTPLISHLMSKRLSAKDRSQLRQLLDSKKG